MELQINGRPISVRFKSDAVVAQRVAAHIQRRIEENDWLPFQSKEDALQSWQKLGGIRVQVLRAYDLIRSAHWRGAASPARLLHRLPSLNRVVPQQPSPSHRLWWAGRNVAVHPSGNSLSVDYCCIELEQAELLLLLGIKPPIIAQLLTHCCHQWKAVYKMESGGTVAT